MEDCDKIIDKLRSARNNFSQVEKWQKFCDVHVKLLKKTLKKPGLNAGEKLKIKSTLAKLLSLREKITREAGLSSNGVSGSGVSDADGKLEWIDLQSAFESRIKTGSIVNCTKKCEILHKDVQSFLEDAMHVVVAKLENIVREEGNVKVNVTLACIFRLVKLNDVIEEKKTFQTKNVNILPSSDIGAWFIEHVQSKLTNKIEDFQDKESGRTLHEISHLLVNINKYEPLRRNLSTYTRLPRDILMKRAVINIENNDPYCFLWSITAALSPPTKKNPERTSSYPHYSEMLNYEGLDFPMSLSNIKKFEQSNGLSIHVLGIDGVTKNGTSKIVPIYLSKQTSDKPTIHLLMIKAEIDEDENEEEEVGVPKVYHHFAWIKNISRLMSAQISTRKHRTWICHRCLCYSNTEEILHRHKEDCSNIKNCRVMFPETESSNSNNALG